MCMAEFKDIFLELRNSKGYNQEQMAQELHVSKATIGMWEIGERKPGPDKYEEIADYFNVDMDYLYGRSSIPRKVIYDSTGQSHSALTIDINLTDHEISLVNKYRSVDEETKKMVDRLLAYATALNISPQSKK